MAQPVLRALSMNDSHLAVIFCGLTIHLMFNKLEHTTPLRYLLVVSGILPLVPCYIFSASPASLSLETSYLVTYMTLIVSVLCYRLSPLHPLWKYPGPILGRCSKFYGIWQQHSGEMYLKVQAMHDCYGDVVRTGPNELTIRNISALQPILGIDGMAKGPLWDGRRAPNSTTRSVITIRETRVHLERRKPWNRALASTSIRGYEPLLKTRLMQLIDALSKPDPDQRTAIPSWKKIDLSHWISLFSYDFMGDMAFGGLGYELMRDGDVFGLWDLMDRGIRVQCYTQHIPWANTLQSYIPGAGAAAVRMRQFVGGAAQTRLKRGMGPLGIDLSSYLLDELNPSPKPMPPQLYAGEAFLAVVAGSDTTATAICSAFAYMLHDKKYFYKLREEIDSNFPWDDEKRPVDDTSTLAHLPMLNGIINESLRLLPPVPHGLQRAPDANKGGKMVGDIFVPEHTAITVSPYTMHRDPRYFSPLPEKFVPERWIKNAPESSNSQSIGDSEYDGVDFVTNPSAFIPYSLGPMNCVGRPLAQMELRVVVATIVQELDLELDMGWDAARWERDIKDHFVFTKGKLPVRVSRRGAAQ
ncbi:hypothetical protein D9619_008353 [Psilocybe cf. subviscida]|uniref:Cytochrome P450 n=1 Tax=Psilocybe cf. subviscida TaxID=2480587 RepID=A0A8H5BB39_9AGAR|nr:hypothetical protein D9619_008353 [Psilocybe cf. subviscida]